MDNDANLGALGEMHYGVARGKNYFAFLSIGTGIGVGLVLDGKVYRGKRNFAGELGHVGVDIHGHQCKCGGIGCSESLASGPSMLKMFEKRLQQGQCNGAYPDELSTRAIFHAATVEQDPLALEVINDVAEIIGYSIRNMNNMLDLELVVLGGGISLAAPQVFLDKVEESANVGTYGALPQDCRIALSKIYPDSIILGAASLVAISYK